jgi:hypothetical protein
VCTDKDMMGEEDFEAEAKSGAWPGLGNLGSFLGGAACMCVVLVASRFAKPALLSLQAFLRRRQSKSSLGHDRTV